MTAFHEYASAAPRSVSKRAFVTNFAQCARKLTVACDWEWDYSTLRAAELTGLNSFQKPRKPPRYAIGPSFASEVCSRSTFFHLWEVVQIFQRESIFCSKISSGGSVFIKKLVPGENQFGRVHFYHDRLADWNRTLYCMLNYPLSSHWHVTWWSQ